MSLVDLQKGMTDLLPSNEGCGVDYPTYSFTQSETEVVLNFPLAAGTAAKMLDIKIGTSTISCGLKGKGAEGILLAGPLFKPIKAEESMWTVEEKKLLVVTLTKTNMQYEEWWPHVVTTERQMDIKTLVPPSKHIRDLDQGAQAQVAKMMYDQDQKRKGLPTSEEQSMQSMMAAAMGGAGGGGPIMMPPGFAPPQ